jgi:hypothetical protein
MAVYVFYHKRAEERIAIAPCAAKYNQILIHLLVEIEIEFNETGSVNLKTAKAIADFLPRIDKRELEYGFSLEGLNNEDLIDLFVGAESRILNLHQVEKPPDSDKNDLPIPSSGDPSVDLFAKLIGVDGTVAGAETLWKSYSFDFLLKLSRQLKEIRRDPDDRITEHLQKTFIEQTTEEDRQRLKYFDFSGEPTLI